MIQIHAATSGGPKLHVLAEFSRQAAEMLADAIVTTIRASGRCRVALAGGSTAMGVYAQLRELLPHDAYAQLWVTWTDEPVLPIPDDLQPGEWQRLDPQSHVYAAYDAWLAHVPVVHAQVLPLAVSADPHRELVRFGRAFQQAFAGNVDIAVIAPGADGHIAALYPQHPATEIDDIALLIHDCPKGPSARLTLSGPQIGRAAKVVVLATGAKKSQLIVDAWHREVDVPLSKLTRIDHSYWLVDHEAAAALIARSCGAPRTA